VETSLGQYPERVAERFLDVERRPDGSFFATFADDRPPARVAGWADIRRLRDRHRLTDQWTGDDRDAFVAKYGHPFDDWWDSLSPASRDALMADPRGPVPPAHAVSLKRSLRHESGRDGLRVEGSFFTAQVREYIAAKAAERATSSSVDGSSEPGA
jgi:hypothetical protein